VSRRKLAGVAYLTSFPGGGTKGSVLAGSANLNENPPG
jgi:hypothetical protein